VGPTGQPLRHPVSRPDWLPGSALPSRTRHKSADRSDCGARFDSPVRTPLGLAAPSFLRPGELTTPPLFLRPLPLTHLSFLRRSPLVASLSPSPEPLLRLPPSLSQRRRCLSSCVMSAALPRARVHTEAPLSGAPSLLSAAELSATVQHRYARPRARECPTESTPAPWAGVVVDHTWHCASKLCGCCATGLRAEFGPLALICFFISE
jgi:hypothetical protein